jgi:hypothetical protein
MNNINFNSKEYWEKRYSRGGNSGVGSQGILAKYKADIINNFVNSHLIQSVCELGCGDSLFELFDFDNYIGYDVSQFIIDNNIKKSKYHFTSNFDELLQYDLVLSLDVILHLIEDDIYYEHMASLFNLSKKYVIIYSPDEDKVLGGIHNKYRKFTNDISNTFQLIEFIENPYKGPHTQADFYIYEKML